jgi:LacI family transcriptional regulator
MRDVATRAGVGIGTVSRVVNDGSGVSRDATQRVRAAIADLGYHRDEIARSLRPGHRSRTLALLLGDLTNPFYATVAGAAVEVARRQGYAVVVGSVDEDPEGERRAVAELTSRRVAGLLLVPDAGDHAFLAGEVERGLAVVFVDRPATGIAADSVVLENEHGGYQATRHLLDHGHRRVAVLVAPSYYTTGRRLRGYRRALREAGLPVPDELVVTLRAGSPEAAAEATRELLARDDPPTAVFTTTNFLTEGVLRATSQLRRPPALVGFDDFRFADMLPTPVTVVSGDTAALGRRAAELLLDRVAGDDAPPQRLALPVRLVARGSGETPP